MKRPLRSRVWFYEPWPGYLLDRDEGFYLEKGWWKPWYFGGDEFNWHTFVIGHPVTGRIVIATRPCPMTGECAEVAEEFLEIREVTWPVDAYGHDHSGNCKNVDCYCQEEL